MTERERRTQFNEMYALYDKRVFAYCLYVTNDRDLAGDVYQEVFVKAYQAIHTLRDPEKQANWLFRIARNECLNALKFRQRSEHRSVNVEYVQDQLQNEVLPETADEIAHLRWAIGQLSPDYREALLLAEFEGFSLKEIAKMTGTSLSNVKVRIHRAKLKLHTLLEPILNDYE
jgi:RNA polymerase sigma-70 factor (ECF subfamily)